MKADWVYLETSQPVKFHEVETVISYLQLMKLVNIEPRNYSINTKNTITTTSIKYWGVISLDEFNILKKYIMERHPEMKIVDIYYKHSE